MNEQQIALGIAKSVIIVFSKNDSSQQFLDSVFNQNAEYLKDKSMLYKNEYGVFNDDVALETNKIVDLFLMDPTMNRKELMVFASQVKTLDDVQNIFDYFSSLSNNFANIKFTYNPAEWTDIENAFINRLAEDNDIGTDAVQFLYNNFSVNDINTFSVFLNQAMTLSRAMNDAFSSSNIDEDLAEEVTKVLKSAWEYLGKNINKINK